MPKSVELNEDKLFAIPLQFNCPARWNDMKGDDRVRACAACKKNVYNISKLKKQEAIELISKNEGDMCIRFYQRRDGTVITRDCTTILGMWRLRRKWNLLAMINAYFATTFGLTFMVLGPSVVTIFQGGMARAKTIEEIEKALPDLKGYDEPAILLPPEPSAAEIELGRKGLH